MPSSSSITINFQSSCQNSGDILVVESDEALNKGKTCFLYDEKYYFKVYPFPVDSILDVIPSAGIISPEGDGVDTIPLTGITGVDDQAPEYASFTNSETAKTNKPISDSSGQADLFRNNCYFVGENNTVVALVGGVVQHISDPSPIVSEGNVLTVPQPIISPYRVQYPSYFKRFSLVIPSTARKEFPVIIYIMSTQP